MGDGFRAPKPTQKPTTQKPRTTQKIDKVPDDFFFALLNSINQEESVKTTKSPKIMQKSEKSSKKLKMQKPDEMRFALNVDEDGYEERIYEHSGVKNMTKTKAKLLRCTFTPAILSND